ncbi:DUF2274 domain-containing protein [Sphingomonas cannabina]|uniref:DUF2274 domain-containing protein n=1 Tax=Sphingomonas cannabina TaxID=2899123 RepID=UPI001F42435E|nr:DUF2274 domain-containing protein [Sphingomonas cannabina]UIJ44741.1 DUF2274 domain-containing protein [Sphingomonas cannabina]
MSGIRLAKLPDRTPIKLTISINPELSRALARYAQFYQTAYRQEVAVAELVPAIAQAFLESDKAFIRWCREAIDRNA